ncbi:MAG TPA: phosphoenolpyruvate-utilizing N-terminal domain-containing protein, partial [Actinomycetes bacterium]|nr:phosphoenolpyruvate-utilizing N-terminal domain-containing protein [Actinomycetes bacterium]
MEEPLKGVGVSPGVAVGPVAVMGGDVPEPLQDAAASGDPEAVAADARAALEAVAADLEARAGAAGGEAADVLAAQAMMVRDPGLDEQVRQHASQGRS